MIRIPLVGARRIGRITAEEMTKQSEVTMTRPGEDRAVHPPDVQAGIVAFGDFKLDATRASLKRGTEEVHLRSQSFDVLRFLVAHRGRVVAKEELLNAIWGSVRVTDDSVVQCIMEIRAALGDSAQQVIKTVPRRGYLFDASVEEERPVTPGIRSATEGSRINGESRGRRAVLWATAAVFAVLVAGVIVWRATGNPAPAVDRAIAVLPFAWLESAPADDYLGRGMADALINRFSRIRGLNVRPTSAVMRVPPETRAQDAARSLGVEYVIEGHLQRTQQRLHVSVQLVAAKDGRVVWSDSYEVEEGDVFKAQAAIAEQAALALTTHLSQRDLEQLRRPDTLDHEAYVAYLTGQHYLSKRSKVGLQNAVAQFERAVSRDPSFARAYAGLADAYDLIGAYGSVEPRKAFRAAMDAAATALKLDPDSAEAMTALAFANAHANHDWKGAEKLYRDALNRAPHYATAHQWLALCLVANGRFAEAIEEARRGLLADPLSLIIHTDLGRHFYYARRFDEAVEQLKHAIELDTNFVRAHQELGRAYKQKGLYAQAIQEIGRAVQLSDRSASAVAELAHAHALAGERAVALALLSELQSRESAGSYVSAYHYAVILAGLGDRERAIDALEKAYEERFNWIVFANVEPEFDTLRAHPRFKALIGRLGVGT